MTGKLPAHQVAITVFLTAPGVDPLDAANRAQLALSNAIDNASTDGHLVDEGHGAATGQQITVHTVMETGQAAGNGYLWLRPTAKVQRDYGPYDTDN